MAWTIEKINEVYAKVQSNAAIDEQFKNDLMKDPVVAIEQFIGEKLPEDHNLDSVDFSYALSDDALESVAGGTGVDVEPLKNTCCCGKATVEFHPK